MKLNKELEKRLKSVVIQYLKKREPCFDVQHTFAAVYWIRRLLEGEKGNEKILIPAIYLHDIGYYNIIKDNKSLDKRIAAKKEHMKKGAKLSRKILKEIGCFSKKEIKEIAHLVRTHDDLEAKKKPNEQLVFEADSLAMVDEKRVKSTFPKKDYKRFLDIFRRKRIPKFKTESGKKFLSKFIKNF